MNKNYGKKIDNNLKIIIALFFGILLVSSSSAFTSGASAQLGSLTQTLTTTTSGLGSILPSTPTPVTIPVISPPPVPVPAIPDNPILPVLPSPTGLTASAVSSSQISLNWNAPSNSGVLVTGYEIERSSDGGTTWSTVLSSTGTVSTIYLDSGLSSSTTYTYRVSAVYVSGLTSPPSNTASATTKSITSTLAVSAQLVTGDTLVGLYTELRNSTGQVAASGFSPSTFVLKNGAPYTVGMGNFGTDVFDHWADNSSATNPRSISISSDTQLTAVYRDTALALAPSRGPVGTNVTVTGTTFSSSATITLSWDGTTLTTVTSNSTGGFTTTFQVPSASNGLHNVQATDGTHTHSTQFMVGPAGPTFPQPPTGLAASVISSSQINLSWTAPSSNGGSAITGYQIERSQDNGTTWSIISSNTGSTSTAYSDTGLTPSTSYTYRVSAINSVGTSSPSNTTSATTQNAPVNVPQPPTGLTASAVSSSQINLSWTAPSDNGSSPITGYKIERSLDNGTIWSIISSNTGSTSTAYSDTGLTPSTSYTYRVSAINSVGTSSPSNTTSATTQSAATLLSPTGLTANTISSSQISLNWNAPSNSGVLVTGYKIERSSDGGVTWSTVQSSTGTTSTIYVDSELSPSTTYTYRVSAVYTGGQDSPPSNTASATTQATTYKLTVSTKLSTGDILVGLYIELRNNTGVVSSGFSPSTFVLKNGAPYTVGMGNFGTDVFDHWADNSSATNPRSISISSDTQLTAVYRDTALALAPSRGPVGTNVTVTGANNVYSPSTTVTLSWDGTTFTTVTSNSAGGFSTTFAVPTTSSGSHKVQATDGTHTHSALFTVGPSPSISVNTSSVNVGTGVRVTGTNFAPNSLITISFNGTPYVQNFTNDSPTPSAVTTDSNGNFVAIIETLRTVAGTYTISVQDSANDIATKSITVTPHVFIYPTSGHAGSSILIPASQGNGFAASSAIVITFDGITIIPSTAMITDTSGSFGGSFTVPSTAALGSHQIQVSDSNGNTYSTSFTVAASTTPTYSVQRVITGLNFPDRFAFIPDNGPGVDGSGALMALDKNSGTVSVFKYSNGQFVNQSKPFVIVPNLQTGFEANGLLGIAFDPNWVSSKLVYFDVTRNMSGNIVSDVIRYHATTDSSGNIIADTSVGEQLVLGNIPAWKDGHNGGDLKFDSQGNLYIAIGDGWNFAAPQDLTTLQGKILRITPLASPVNGNLYSIPSTNPFASSTNVSIKKEIWGNGVRHPWSLDIDSKTGKLYVSDVGYNSWERIENFTAASANAGWPNYEGPAVGNPQNLASYTSQLYWYPHEGVEPQTGPTAGLEAISSGAFYHGTYYPNLNGAYFFGDYGVGNIVALLPSSVAPPTTDPASGDPKGQVLPIFYGLNEAPVDMSFWNGKLYFVDITGNLDVLNYN